jgi:hypothetical protein
MLGVSRGLGESAASGAENRTSMAAEGEIALAPRVGHTVTTRMAGAGLGLGEGVGDCTVAAVAEARRANAT